MPTQDKTGDKLLVFLSHASEDKPRVKKLCKRLRDDGFDPWLDEERLVPGQDWNLEIQQAMRQSQAILLCFSKLSVAKEGYVQREYKKAQEYQLEKPEGTIFVIPVRLDDCEVPFSIRDLQYVDYPDGYERLVKALNIRAEKVNAAKAEPKPEKKTNPAPRVRKPEKISSGPVFNIGTITVGRDLIQGDQTNYPQPDFSRMEAQLDKIIAKLSQPSTSIQIGGEVRDSILLVGDGNDIQISRAELEGMTAWRSGASAGRREQIYLTNLLLRDTYAPWEQLYVPLSGNVLVRQAVEDLPVRYSEFIVPVEGQGGQGQVTMRPLKDITEAMQNHTAFIVLGAPGAGKTTTLQKIAFDAGRAYLQKRSGWVPLFVRLSEQRERDPYTFLQNEWERNIGTSFEQALRARQILILADGINEIPRDRRTERLKEWRNFDLDHRGGNFLIFSGRALDYGNELDLPRVLVEPLEKGQIADFLKRHKADGLADKLEDDDGRLLEIAKNPLNLLVLATLYKINPAQSFTNLGKLFQAFSESLFNREQREHPGKLPVEAMRLALARLAFTMQEQGEGLTFTIETARKALPQQVDVKAETITIDVAQLFNFGRGATILDPNLDTDVRFRHHVLQEYFAGLELLHRFDAGEDLTRLWKSPRTVDEMPPTDVGEWDPLPEPPGTGWEVTTILACGLSRAPEKLIEAARQANPALAARCLDEAGNGKPESVTQVVQQNLLADLYDPNMHLRARLQAGFLLGKIGDPRFVPQSLPPSPFGGGAGGGVKVVLPQMVNVPGGKYTIGSNPGEPGTYQQEYPQHEVEIAPFAIGKWPVTNAEYACFMTAGGYENEEYWQTDLAKRWLKGEEVGGGQVKAWLDDWKTMQSWPDVRKTLEQSGNFSPEQVDMYVYVAGLTEEELKEQLGKQLSQKSRTQPANWNDSQYNNPSQPVVGVTWFEASAYCAWLSAVTGQPYRLPTEAEWEAAARGLPTNHQLPVTNRSYPWGDAWDKDKANSLEGRVLKPSPVGAYTAAGAVGPFGAEDQAGNVYNWTSSLYLPYPYDPAQSEILEFEGERVVRGGSWFDLRNYLRCAFRFRCVPVIFSGFVGFRLVSPGL